VYPEAKEVLYPPLTYLRLMGAEVGATDAGGACPTGLFFVVG